jgi:hypothetical protein
LNTESHNDITTTNIDEDDDLFEGFQGAPELVSTELDNWLAQTVIDYKKGDVKAFWLSKGYDFKIILQMARDHLAVPATSAASERVFSDGGEIITKRRGQLSHKNVRYQLCLRDWGILAEPIDNEAMGDDFATDEEAEATVE